MKTTPVWVLILALLLVSCGPTAMAFTPEQAAVQAATNSMRRNARVISDSIQVLQTQELDESVFAVVAFQQLVEGRQEDCLMMYQVQKVALGAWAPRSGGGGCSSQVGVGSEPEPPTGVEVGGGTMGSSEPADPGYSHASGRVHQDEITQVRVTWSDGAVQEVPVVNGSYLAIRRGEFAFERIEGLDADGEVFSTSEHQIPPGKR